MKLIKPIFLNITALFVGSISFSQNLSQQNNRWAIQADGSMVSLWQKKII